jgi:arylformamidase
MKANIEWNGKRFEVDFSSGMDISIPMQSGSVNPNAFHIPMPLFEPIKVGDFVGSVAMGSGANCENLHINAHGNGTHTESIGHITLERISINSVLNQFHFIAQVISVESTLIEGGDSVVFGKGVPEILQKGVEAVILRTLPNGDEKRTKLYSGNNPTYLDPKFVRRLVQAGINHLLVDLPSVDREEDGGAMAAHKAFWQFPENPRTKATITEMVFVPNYLPDGVYLLNLQIASLETDASPSKPVLYELWREKDTQ